MAWRTEREQWRKEADIGKARLNRYKTSNQGVRSLEEDHSNDARASQ